MTTNGRMIALALGGLLGMAGGMPGGLSPDKAPMTMRAPAMRPSRKAILSGSHHTGIIRFGYGKKPPSTKARERRAAVKAKNRAKHRAHMKGRA